MREAVRLIRVARWSQLKDELLLRPEIQRLKMLTRAEIPDVQLMAVLAGEQQLRNDAVLDHVRRSPLAGDHRVLAEVPGEVVSKVLRPTVRLPGALDRKVIVVEHHETARSIAIGCAQSIDIDPIRAAVNGMGATVARLARHLL